MKLSLQMGQRQSLGLHLGQRQTMSLEQRQLIAQQHLAVQGMTLGIRQDLIYAVTGKKFNPSALCPRCSFSLKPIEILKGFTASPTDITTECSRCHLRFEPTLLARESWATVEVRFFCPSQTLHALPGLERFRPNEFVKHNASVHYSALYHFGNLRNSFRQIAITYPFAEEEKWETKIVPFLGRLPDGQAASAVGVPVNRVSALRRSYGIKPFRPSEWMAIAE